ncbi:hypothetical protein ACYEXS_03280 [Paenibacillus sp. MAH-36]|uniref:Uncharacterized protein n=1 Tax=Paenibacillus violae TaxID=3077234 RepID=A0ABU3RBC4_9BACL|nr:hypothetical protein [Paenibacillus sp. PFR10]MDU0201548.1 hypothetical protein [Paenibacillus sp. PFR10]
MRRGSRGKRVIRSWEERTRTSEIPLRGPTDHRVAILDKMDED